MNRKKYLLIGDGSSDKCLLPIISFFLNEHFQDIIFKGEWADFSFLPKPPKTLAEKIISAIDLYEPDWVFIHRDAEGEPRPLEKRSEEIDEAIVEARELGKRPFIKVIPIRMTESWLLIDKNAIRKASNNPNGQIELVLPAINQLENINNPKETLFTLIKKASGLSGRKLESLNVYKARTLIAEYINDYSLLRNLSSFQYFESQLEEIKLDNQ
jgi:hypothetical protein